MTRVVCESGKLHEVNVYLCFISVVTPNVPGVYCTSYAGRNLRHLK
jgi:hypothetical protein